MSFHWRVHKHRQTTIEFVQTTGQAVMHASPLLKLEHCLTTSRRLHDPTLPASVFLLKMKMLESKSQFCVKLYGNCFQSDANLSTTDGFIFGKWRLLNETESMNAFLAVCISSTVCVNFHVGTFQVHTRLLANLNFLF